MPNLVVVDREGVEHTVEGQEGHSVMEVIRAGGMDELLAICGGNCSCATCHVYVDQAFLDKLPGIETGEDDLLECLGTRRAESRLSCQLTFSAALEGLRVTIAPED